MPQAPRLLCDEMLAALARWLRAAGHDTALAEPGAPDAALVQRCREEGRVLVTRDRSLAGARAVVPAVLLMTEDLDDQARALAERLDLDWLKAPFTRCMMDNAVLRPATAGEIAALPGQTRTLSGPFRACPVCGRLFWPGSHVRRMTERLERWAQMERTRRTGSDASS
jgi:uncharacterized protein with PIN domain